jgi:hypothetical protein
MPVHKCPICHLMFHHVTELEEHAREEHISLTVTAEELAAKDDDEWRLVRHRPPLFPRWSDSP